MLITRASKLVSFQGLGRLVIWPAPRLMLHDNTCNVLECRVCAHITARSLMRIVTQGFVVWFFEFVICGMEACTILLGSTGAINSQLLRN